jgi:hypothetical protein
LPIITLGRANVIVDNKQSYYATNIIPIKHGGDVMAKHGLNTTFDADIYQSFKRKCDQNGFGMNEVLQLFMVEYINGNYEVEKTMSLKKM